MVLNPTTFPSRSGNAESLPSLGLLRDESQRLPTLLGDLDAARSHSLWQKWSGTPGQAPSGAKAFLVGGKKALVRRKLPLPFSQHRFAGQAEVEKDTQRSCCHLTHGLCRRRSLLDQQRQRGKPKNRTAGGGGKKEKETKQTQILVFNAKSQLARLPVTLATFLVVAIETEGMERASPCRVVAAPGIISGGRETPGARHFMLWQGGRREGLFLLAPTPCASFSCSKRSEPLPSQ